MRTKQLFLSCAGLAIAIASALAVPHAHAQQVFGSTGSGTPSIVGMPSAGQVFQSFSSTSAVDAARAASDTSQKVATANSANASSAGQTNRPRAAQHQTLGSHAQYHGFGVVSNSLNFSTSWTPNSAGQVPDLDTHVLLPAAVGGYTVVGGQSPLGVNTPHRPWAFGTLEFERNVYYVQPTISFNGTTATAQISQDVDGKVSSSGTCSRGGSFCEQVSVTGKIPTGVYTQQTYRPLASPADPVPNFPSTGSTFQTEVWTTRALVGPGIIVDSVTVGGVPQPMIKRPDGSLSVRTAAMGGALMNDKDQSAQIIVNARQTFARGVASEVDGKNLIATSKPNSVTKSTVAHQEDKSGSPFAKTIDSVQWTDPKVAANSPKVAMAWPTTLVADQRTAATTPTIVDQSYVGRLQSWIEAHPRAIAGVQLVGGVMEIGAAGFICVESVGFACGVSSVLAAQGADYSLSALNTLRTGKPSATVGGELTQRGLALAADKLDLEAPAEGTGELVYGIPGIIVGGHGLAATAGRNINAMRQEVRIASQVDSLPGAFEFPALPPSRSSSKIRDSAGTAFADNLPDAIAGNWIKGGGQYAAFPGQIAKKLSGSPFKSFDEFRRAFWTEVGKDPSLRAEFVRLNPRNATELDAGRSPFAPLSQQVGGRTKYELDHIIEIQNGGPVFGMNNLRILSPRMHISRHN
jgi:hypothetical protein